MVAGLVIALVSAASVTGQSSYKLYFTGAELFDYERDFLRRPKYATCEIFWDIYQIRDNTEVQSRLASLTDYSLVQVERVLNGAVPETVASWPVSAEDTSYVIEHLEVGKRYGFVIRGTDGDGVIVLSDTAWITPGIAAIQDSRGRPVQEKGKEIISLLLGKLLPMIIGHGDVYEDSNLWGKGSFFILQYLLITGCIFLFISWREMKMKRIFPLKDHPLPSKNVTECYKKNINAKFDDFSFTSQETDDSFYAGEINESKMNSFSIYRRWHFIVMKNKYDMNRFITGGSNFTATDIETENIRIWNKNNSSRLVRNIIQKIKDDGFDHYPIGRIFKAGLENYEHGGIKWMDVSVEVDRAMENRVESELIELERNSKMNWLMNIGTVAPMVGLLGTATGISQAFSRMQALPATATHQDVTTQLAGGIYSALWTTILGLILALFFMFMYYYFQHKLDRINAKWKELYLMVSELL
ncbi:MotA/TolQ/ExbB proton channel family protein [bacterium]|nr:MotA/TolQ/ExbB proton channel family protein [bacterium]